MCFYAECAEPEQHRSAGVSTQCAWLQGSVAHGSPHALCTLLSARWSVILLEATQTYDFLLSRNFTVLRSFPLRHWFSATTESMCSLAGERSEVFRRWRVRHGVGSALVSMCLCRRKHVCWPQTGEQPPIRSENSRLLWNSYKLKTHLFNLEYCPWSHVHVALFSGSVN